jgi:Fe-S oxidoreductase
MEPCDRPIVIDDELWEELLELTHGAAALCFQCGVCTATCPWGLVKEETVSVRTLIRRAQLGFENNSDALWLCTTCAKCEAYCPRGVSIADVVRGLRALAWKHRAAPEGLPSVLWSLFWNENPWEQPPSQRSQWAKELDLPTFDPAEHEILYYVGSAAAYDRRAQQVARALVRLLRAAGVSFGTLGEEEPPSGADALDLGHRPFFEEIAAKSAARLRERGVTRLLTTSPHSYDAFKNHYPEVSEGFEPLHYTQFLAQLVDEGRLALEKPVALKVAFHDPCYLARHNEEIEAPRRVLRAVPGLELLEMESSGVDTLCCGGGGGRMWLETAAGERFGDLRAEEALAAGADVLATACPYCIACLEDSLKARKIEGLRVLDVAEIAERSLPED